MGQENHERRRGMTGMAEEATQLSLQTRTPSEEKACEHATPWSSLEYGFVIWFPCSSFMSVAMIEYPDKKQHREERVYLATVPGYTPSLQGSQGRN